MKMLVLLGILILAGCGEMADNQAAKDKAAQLEKETKKKKCPHGHDHDEDHDGHEHDHDHHDEP